MTSSPVSAAWLTLARRAATVWRTASPTQQLLARLVIVWVTPDDTATQPQRQSDTNAVDDLLCDRVEAATERARRGEPFVAMAAPTHHSGVIDPTVLAGRLRAVSEAPDPAELTAALLRLPPDRDRLREARRMLPADDAAARWFDEWTEHCERDATRPSAWSCVTRTTARGTRSASCASKDWAPSLHPAGCRRSVSARHVGDASRRTRRAWRGWGLSSPACQRAGRASARRRSAPRTASADVAHGDPAFLELLFDRDVRLGDDANLLLALALNNQRATVRTVAVDVTISALDDGRLDPRGLGMQVGRLTSSGLVTPSRWVGSLADVAGATSDHRAAVLQALEQAFAIADPPKPQDLLGLLELFEALALDSGATLTDESAHASVSRIAGTSKTAKTRRGSSRWRPDDHDDRRARLPVRRRELSTTTTEGGSSSTWPPLVAAHRIRRWPKASSAAPTAARALLLVANVAGARFWTPPNMVAAAIEAADPVVTTSRVALRFESSRDAAVSTRGSTWTRLRSTAASTRTGRRTSTSTHRSGPRAGSARAIPCTCALVTKSSP